MRSERIPSHPKPKAKSSKWRKIKSVSDLYQYVPSGMFVARVRRGGKLHRESLKTKDLAFAKRKLHDFKQRLERTDPRFNRMTLVQWLEQVYYPMLRGSRGMLQAKKRISSCSSEHYSREVCGKRQTMRLRA